MKERRKLTGFILTRILLDIVGPDMSETQLRYLSSSIVGQCLFHHCGRQVISRLHPDVVYGPGEIEQLAQHITRFSLAGIQGVVGADKPAPEPGPACVVGRIIKAVTKPRSAADAGSRTNPKKGPKS